MASSLPDGAHPMPLAAFLATASVLAVRVIAGTALVACWAAIIAVATLV